MESRNEAPRNSMKEEEFESVNLEEMTFDQLVKEALASNTEAFELLSNKLLKKNADPTDLSDEQIEMLAQEVDIAISKNEDNVNAIYFRAALLKIGKAYCPQPLPEPAQQVLRSNLDKDHAPSLYLSAAILNEEDPTNTRVHLLLWKAAKQKHKEALYQLSRWYYTPPNGQKPDYKAAAKYLDEAITAGHDHAKVVRAKLFLDESAGEPNYRAAIELLDSLVDKLPDAMIQRAFLHLKMKGHNPSPITGIKMLRKAHLLENKNEESQACQIAREFLHDKNPEIAYHACMILYSIDKEIYLEEFIKTQPNLFLKNLSEDDLLGDLEKAPYLNFLNQLMPLDKKFKSDLAYRDLFRECYLRAAHAAEQKEDRYQAFKLYSKIPSFPRTESEKQNYSAIACLSMANILYQQAIAEQNSPLVAFEIAYIYLVDGIRNFESDACEKRFNELLNLVNKSCSEKIDLTDSWSKNFFSYLSYTNSLPAAEFRLARFIAKYHLRNPSFWDESNNDHNTVTIKTKEGITYRVPELIGKFINVIESSVSAEEKLKQIYKLSDNRFGFFNSLISKITDEESPEAVECYEEAKKLNRN